MRWEQEAASHVRAPSARYADAVDIEPEWTVEVVNDPDRLLENPTRGRHI